MTKSYDVSLNETEAGLSVFNLKPLFRAPMILARRNSECSFPIK